jgi:hypothetical protein
MAATALFHLLELTAVSKAWYVIYAQKYHQPPGKAWNVFNQLIFVDCFYVSFANF